LYVEKVLEGDVRATARLIRRIDDGDHEVYSELSELYKHTGRAHIIGFTGSPGVGKSTLVDKIVTRFRNDGKSVGILAVDPTSPFSGGAILGDRIRMQKHFLDPGVFIRSLATRGKFGGLTRSTADAIVVLDAMGKDVIIVETVGVGQDEVDIANNAHTTVLVTIPGMGDDIQAIKAGLMEIGDLFVVNKADRDGTNKTVKEIKFMLQMSGRQFQANDWIPQVIETEAVQERGIEELYKAILDHKEYLMGSGANRLKQIEYERVRSQLLELVRGNLMDYLLEKIGGIKGLDHRIEKIASRKEDPYLACEEIVQELLGQGLH
jgi:LAO/AO transport system kinase